MLIWLSFYSYMQNYFLITGSLKFDFKWSVHIIDAYSSYNKISTHYPHLILLLFKVRDLYVSWLWELQTQTVLSQKLYYLTIWLYAHWNKWWNAHLSLSLIYSKFYQLFLPALLKNLPIILFYSHLITYYSHFIPFALLLCILTSRETWVWCIFGCITIECR